MNCKLYGKECQQTGRPKSKTSTRHSRDASSVSTTSNVVSSATGLPFDESCSRISNQGDWTPGIQEHSNVNEAASHHPDFEISSSENQLTVQTTDEHPSQTLQHLDELFTSEVLRSNIPFQDFSFLDDLVNDPFPDPLATDFPASASSLNANAPDEDNHGDLRERAETPRSKTTPISPYCQQEDKVSGLDSLQPDSGRPQGSERHIPPGLFIGIEETKSGFLGQFLHPSCGS